MVDVRIKPLKWEQDEYGCYHAETEIGEYIAWPNGRAQFGPFRTTHVNGGEKGAMAAGEADYERRIRSTLSDAVAEREADPVAFPECVLGLIDEKITLVFESPEDARVAFDIIEHTITTPPTSELEALRKRVAELEGEREEDLAAREIELAVSFDNGHYRAMSEHATPWQNRAEAAEARLAEAIKEIRWAHDTLYEINPSNYDHDEVCKLNNASVEVILGLALMLGEKHGKSDAWWADLAARRVCEGGKVE